MIKRIIKGIVLAVFFAGALLISNYVMNRGTDDKIMTMGEPTLPVVSFTVSGQEINLLSGYVDQMDVTAMRDTITPLESNGTLQAEIAENGNKISKISYKVYSLDGADTYAEGKVKEEDGKVTLELGTALDQSAQEAVLKLTLTLGSGEAQKKVNYFTRIEKPDEITAWKCLTFAKDFHAKALDQSDEDTLSMYLEPGEESDNTTYQTVNIHSDITHIQWGDLNPEIVGDVQWSLKESNSVYTSILAKYQVRCQDDKEETARYNVKEFFRIRSVGDTIYLLDYNRDLQEVFSSSRSVMDQKGILLGIVPEDVPYETNKKDSILAFVQNRTLWMYNKKNEELTKVFSFAEEDTQDVRSLNDQHAVRIISMDDHGNIAFAVYGYMNRGEHEGEVGVGIYYFNVDSNLIQEKGFIPSTKSFAIAEDELGKMVYYNHAQELLYVLADQVLYRIDLDKNQQEVLAKGLEAGKYAVSDDGHQLAYQTDGEKDAAKEIRVMDLSSGDEYSVKAAKNEAVRPLGFLNGDFIYGILRQKWVGLFVVILVLVINFSEVLVSYIPVKTGDILGWSFYYLTGGYIGIHWTEIVMPKKKYLPVVILGIGMCFSFVLSFVYGENGWIYIYKMCGAAFLWYFISAIELAQAPGWMKNTFVIYAVHQIMALFINKLTNLLFGNSMYVGGIIFLFIPVVVVVFCYFMELFMKTYFPTVWKIISGRR